MSLAGDLYAKYSCRNDLELFMKKATMYIHGISKVNPVPKQTKPKPKLESKE